ncbi:MAG: hypothetical protein KDK07_17040 [Bauldia sp.]|nr:hypothetical protein [Bauldia sp.]
MTSSNFVRAWIDRHFVGLQLPEGEAFEALVAAIERSAEERRLPMMGVRYVANTLNALIAEELRRTGAIGGSDPKPDERVIVYPNGGPEGGPVGTGLVYEIEHRRETEHGEPGEPHPELAKKPEKALESEVRLDLELDELDVKALRAIERSDKVVAGILQMQEWGEDFAKALKKAAPGPLKVAAVFIEQQIKVWGAANKLLNETKVEATCKLINAQATMAEGENRYGARDFRDTLGAIRGCK